MNVPSVTTRSGKQPGERLIELTIQTAQGPKKVIAPADRPYDVYIKGLGYHHVDPTKINLRKPEERKAKAQTMLLKNESLNPNQIPIPQTYEEAMASDQSEQWQEAMLAEYNGLISNQTWKMIDKPDDKSIRPLKGKWVYTLKLTDTGEIKRFKARYVLKGYLQKQGRDFDQVFSPVARQYDCYLLGVQRIAIISSNLT